MSGHQHTNRLIHEKSPYLLQHAHNPVDWHPWGPEAFEKAKAENKPLLVSIGYATCHWCHVMERESFENETTAEFLNENFVPIKVDREERPDVDKVHMDALHAMGEQGGWPLNVFLTPDGEPFYGGTYWPPNPMYGRASFPQVLAGVANAWQEKQDQVKQQAGQLTGHLKSLTDKNAGEGGDWTFGPEEKDAEIHRQTFDGTHGGFLFHHNNKFPPSMGLLSLLRMYDRTGEEDLLHMVTFTVQKMKQGGIYDQLGGGLCRYATDQQWLVPHFEKMLYDNALWVWLLVACFQVTGDATYRDWAYDTLAYIQRDMTHPDGAFYSAEDADSEGVEGKFYVWTLKEIEDLLDGPARDVAMHYWNVTPSGNFEHGTNILNVQRPMKEVATALGIGEDTAATALQEAREKLMAVRGGRIRPLLDDKILTSWNALMISALCRAGMAFGDPQLIQRAEKAMAFLRKNLVDESGRLLRRWRDGEARYPAYLVDHAQLGVAALDLYEATFHPDHAAHAKHLADEIQRLFRREEGGYYDTGADAEQLLVRTMEGYDGVEPSGNSAASNLFFRLWGLGAGQTYHERALHILNTFRANLEKMPISHGAMLETVHRLVRGQKEVALVGPAGNQEVQAALGQLRAGFFPHVVTAFAEPDHLAAHVSAGVRLMEGRERADGRSTFYLCENLTCRLPVHTSGELLTALKRSV